MMPSPTSKASSGFGESGSRGDGYLPRVAPNLDINDADDGLVVYQEATDKVHHLNPTAAAILGLCDGTRSAPQIAEALGELFSLDNVPLAETEGCLTDLRREQLIV
jgi:Coenzyme PQQ synthesis protein D (PqqD)